MIEKAPKGGWKLKEDSFSKLAVWFQDGNKMYQYSLDWRHKYSGRDREIGIARYKKSIAKWGSRAKSIHIYDLTTDTLIGKYYEGVEIITLQ